MAAYEKLRQMKLEENKRKIQELNLGHLALSLRDSSPAKSSPTKQLKRKIAPKDGVLVAVRRSDRVAKLPETNYKEETHLFLERPRVRSFKRRRDLDDRVYASDEAREYTTERAEKHMDGLDPEFPSFVKPMTQSHVTGGFWLGLPRPFCTRHLPRKDTHISLIDENGDESETLYLAQKNGLSAGWRGFSIDHELVDGDALVFRLVKPTAFKVYIFRASDYDGA